MKCPYCGKTVHINKRNGQCPHCLKIIEASSAAPLSKETGIGSLEERLFTSAGCKIKKLSRILFRVGVILSILGGVGVILWDLFANIIPGYGDATTHLATFIPSIVGAALGCVLSWISAVLLYGFGEIVERAEK